MEIKNNEVLFIYNSGKIKDRQALGYAKTARSVVLKEFDVKNQPFTLTQLKEVSNRLGIEPRDMVSDKSDVFKNAYRHKDVSPSDLLKALQKEPDLLRTPIAVYSHDAEFVKSPYEFVQKDMRSERITTASANRQEKGQS